MTKPVFKIEKKRQEKKNYQLKVVAIFKVFQDSSIVSIL